MNPTRSERALRRLAASYGVQPFYRDVQRRRQHPEPEALLGVLRALGEPLESVEDAPAALHDRRVRLAARRVEPVAVAWERQRGSTVRITVPEAETVECSLELEGGKTLSWSRALDRLAVVGRCGPEGARLAVCRLPLPRDLPRGYHRLTVAVRGARDRSAPRQPPAECLVIVAPRRVYDGDPQDHEREWGVFLPVYSIRRDGNLGVGDLAGLERLGRWIGGLGGSSVATLPLLPSQLYEAPDTYSPYGPVSRLFWNELFVDPRRLPELERSPEARRLLESEALQREVEELKSQRLIDYGRVAALKRRVLEPLARTFFDKDAPEARRRALHDLRERRPELDDYAAFRAAAERHGAAWQDWPQKLRGDDRKGEIGEGDYDRDVFRFHLYSQLVAEEQVAAAAETLSGNGGLYLDLPLGVHPSSFDVWRERHLFARGASAGAPPDPMFTGGQDWGFHPMHPEHQREEGYRHLRAVLRHHLRYAGTLRIDHVMQLHRLFWIPRGVDKRNGVYVRYPSREHYAILSLESHRTRSILVGENLGTVPPYVNRALSRHGIRKMYVFPFEVDEALPQGRLHRPVPDDAVASMNTHDMPTFRAFWEGADIADRRDLGLLGEGEAQAEARDREHMRQLWRRGLTRSGHLPPGAGEREVLEAALVSLAESEAPLVLVNLEDLWGELEPQNTPGTWKERPNWQRRASRTLEEITSDPDVSSTLERIDAARRREPKPPKTVDPGAADRPPPPDSAATPEDIAPGTASPGASSTAIDIRTPESATGRISMSDRPDDDTRRDVPETRQGGEGGGSPAATAVESATGPAATRRPTEPDTTHGEAGEMQAVRRSLFTEDDLFLFNEGRHFKLYEKLGAHRRTLDGTEGYNFAVWAPDAESVHVVGDFNGWNQEAHGLSPQGHSGIWEGFLPHIEPGANYKFHIRSRFGDYRVDKADPFAIRSEEPPRTGSVLWELDYEWNDDDWMASRKERSTIDAPVSIYEIHLGSWRRVPEEGNRYLTYREVAEPLADHLEQHGFTHVELLPLMEHPFYGSWGYQTTGYFAPTARYGTPQDFMYLVDYLHQRGFGVLLDWVPSHFPSDEHGLGYFDGTHLFEHADPRLGYHPDWNSFIFNYGRNEVRSFLISSALYWLDKYHIDGLRVDAVASMLYLDYSRKEGEWIPNEHGGRENLDAIEFLRQLNSAIYEHHPDVQTYAEESTSWGGVSRPTYVGGLGFGYKWDMGWMHDTLQYFAREPVHRKFHQGELTFRMVYAWSENFTLPISHDEVVHGKGSMIGKMPGDDWQKFANLRLLYGYMWAEPGKKLLFMGSEIGQRKEWAHEGSLDWHLLDEELHRGMSRWVGDLNRVYRGEPALHELDCDPAGFEWIDASDQENSVLCFLRKGKSNDDRIVALFNFTPVPRHSYRVGVPRGGYWQEVLNSDAPDYGGSGQGNLGGVDALPIPLHGRSHSLTVTIPPLGAVFLKSPGASAGGGRSGSGEGE